MVLFEVELVVNVILMDAVIVLGQLYYIIGKKVEVDWIRGYIVRYAESKEEMLKFLEDFL